MSTLRDFDERVLWSNEKCEKQRREEMAHARRVELERLRKEVEDNDGDGPEGGPDGGPVTPPILDPGILTKTTLSARRAQTGVQPHN